LNTVNEIADNIIKKYEKKLLDKIINTHYFYFLNYEKVKIIEKALQRLELNEDEVGQLRVDIIHEKLEEYLAANPLDGLQNSTLEGFVRFRLREYYSILEAIIDDAAQEYLIEREYEEFIGLLKYFLEISESKLPILHIMSGDFGYKFLDNNRNDITTECMVDFLTPIEEVGVRHSPYFFANECVNYDDMLISTLLMLAPSKILWYNADENSEITETVKKIFEEKVSFC